MTAETWVEAPLTDAEVADLARASRNWVPAGYRRNPDLKAYEAASLFQLLMRDYMALRAKA